MKQYKKRTLALVLASVITVVGAFGAENYKNNLMSLKFTENGSDSVSMTVYTKKNYEQSIHPIRKDANTYVIMLPDTNSEMPQSPVINSRSIQSVNVVTMPFTTSSSGYTKITVKTDGNISLMARNAVYIPQQTREALPAKPVSQPQSRVIKDELPPPPPVSEVTYENNARQGQSVNNDAGRERYAREENSAYKEPQKTNEVKQKEVTSYNSSESTPTEKIWILAGFILVSALVIFVYFQSKERMASIIGEQTDFDLDFDEKKEKEKEQKRARQISKTINKLDKTYTPLPKVNIVTGTQVPQENSGTAPQETEPEEDNIVDLDSLFKEKQAEESTEQSQEGDSDDLADFLSEFSFEEDVPAEEPVIEENPFDEEFFNKCLNSEFKFTEDDIAKIDQLIQVEISDETLSNLEEFLAKPQVKQPTKAERLENILAAYTINQNLEFSKDDIDAISELMDVELDKDFLTDLRTNPDRVKAVMKELEEKEAKPHKASEIITLNVKDMLPDLSRELKKQGHKKIEYGVKPQVVYFSEGYDVSKLNISSELPTFEEAMKDKHANEYRPSDAVNIAETGYDVATLSIKDALPDLKNAKFDADEQSKPKQPKANEKDLLKTLSGVSFKPFYEENEQEKHQREEKVKEELSHFANFEVVSDEELEENEVSLETEKGKDEFADVQELISIEQTDSAAEIIPEQEPERISEQEQDSLIEPEPEVLSESLSEPEAIPVLEIMPEPKTEPALEVLSEAVPETIQVSNAQSSVKTDGNTQALLKKIEEQKSERQIRRQQQEQSVQHRRSERSIQRPLVREVDADMPKNIAYQNVEYEVLSKAKFNSMSGCYLCKHGTEYTILGYFNDKIQKLKQYDTLRTENLQARMSDKNESGGINYIVRVSIHKFVVRLSKESMEFIMDLC